MRKTLYLLLSIISLTISVNSSLAQTSDDYKHDEIYFGYGYLSSFTMLSLVDNAADLEYYATIPYTGTPEINTSYLGPFHLGYNHFFGRHISGGVVLTAENVKTVWNYENDNEIIRYNIKSNLMIRSDIHYINNGTIDIYSGLAAGAGYIQYLNDYSNNDKTADPEDIGELIGAFQVNAIGIRIGKGFGVKVEGGFGSLGLVNAGISMRF